MAHQRKFSAVKVVKEMSRERFANMPKERRVSDKRKKQPRMGWKEE